MGQRIHKLQHVVQKANGLSVTDVLHTKKVILKKMMKKCAPLAEETVMSFSVALRESREVVVSNSNQDKTNMQKVHNFEKFFILLLWYLGLVHLSLEREVLNLHSCGIRIPGIAVCENNVDM